MSKKKLIGSTGLLRTLFPRNKRSTGSLVKSTLKCSSRLIRGHVCFHRIHCRFSSGEAPKFTAKPQSTVIVVEGDNTTLEWMYNFGTGSLLRITFLRSSDSLDIVERISGVIALYIDPAYRGRLLVNVTDTYTSITFLGVNRTDSTGYTLKIVTDNGRPRSLVKISVQCKYEK